MKQLDKIINSTIVKHTDLIEEYLDCNDEIGESIEEFVAKFDVRRMLSLEVFYGDYTTNEMLDGVTVMTILKSEYSEGKPISIVFHIIHHDTSVYVRRTGIYSSYDPIEWDDEIEEVFPVEVMVTKFKRADGYVYKEIVDV